MRQYEVTFIVDPVLSGDEVKSTVNTYKKLLEDAGCTIVNLDEMGLRQLAYPINRRNTGVYFCIEFQPTSGEAIDSMELSFRRDERIMRFLTVKLDKYGIKYNDDKRNGRIGSSKKEEVKKEEVKSAKTEKAAPKKEAPKKEETSKKEEAPVAVEENNTPVEKADVTPTDNEGDKA